MILNFLSVVAVLLALFGTYLNANKKRSGFYFWIGTNAFFCLHSAAASLWAQSVLFLAYFFLAIKGLYTWKE